MFNANDDGAKRIRADWIGRFFGYLKSRQITYGKTRRTDLISTEWDFSEEAENIVYIYGVPKTGKSVYSSMLVSELESRKYAFCIHEVQKDKDVLNELQQSLTDKLGFSFPYMKILETKGKSKGTELVAYLFSGGSFVWKVVKLFIGSLWDGIELFAQLVLDVIKGKRVLGQIREEKKAYKELQAETGITKDEDRQWIRVNDDDRFNFFRLDLCANAKRRKKKQIVCVIDNFELLNPKNGTKESFLKMLSSVEDIVWVLLSKKNPDELICKYVLKDNQWRMDGVSKKRTKEYLTEKVQNADDRWYDSVYEHTGGYINLISNCVAAANNPAIGLPELDDDEKIREELDRQRERLTNELLAEWEKTSATGEAFDKKYTVIKSLAELKDISSETTVSSRLSRWFKDVWEQSDVLHSLFDESENAYRAQCLHYLAEKSKENIGTIHQYSWKRSDNIASFNQIGRESLRYLEQTMPFCLEYEEEADRLYLDPVWVKLLVVLPEHQECYENFVKYCVETQQSDKTNWSEYENEAEKENRLCVNGKDTSRENKIEEPLVPMQPVAELLTQEVSLDKQERLPDSMAETENSEDTSNKIALVDREKQQGKESETTKDSLLNDSGEAPNETDKNDGKKK